MSENIPLYEIGLSKEDPTTELVMSKLYGALEKAKNVLSDIIEAKISVEHQNPEGSRTHYNATFTVITSKKRLIYTDEGWDILKIADELSRKLENELTSMIIIVKKKAYVKKTPINVIPKYSCSSSQKTNCSVMIVK